MAAILAKSAPVRSWRATSSARALRAAICSGDGVFRNAHQDLRQVQLDAVGGGGLLGGQVGVDLGVRHLDLAVDFVFDQALQDDLVADLLAELGEGHAFLFHLVAHVLHAHLLAFGDAADGAIELGIRDAHAIFLAHLQLGALGDHGFDHLAAQVFRGRQLGALGAQAGGDFVDAVVDFARVMTSSLTMTYTESMTFALLAAGGRKPVDGLAWAAGAGLAAAGAADLLGQDVAGCDGAQEHCGQLDLMQTGSTHIQGSTHFRVSSCPWPDAQGRPTLVFSRV